MTLLVVQCFSLSISATSFDPAIVLFMFMLSFVCVIVSGRFEWTRINAGSYICIAISDPVIERGGLTSH